MNVDNPLTKNDLKDIKDALYKLNQLNPLIELLVKLGQDVSDLTAQAKFYHGVLTTLHKELFPNVP